MEFEVLEVGEKYRKFAVGSDITHFDIRPNGAELCVLFNRPSEREINAFKATQRAEFRLFEYNHILYMLAKFGEIEWVDAPYNPHISAVYPDIKITGGLGLAISLIFADSASGLLHQYRLFGLDELTSRKIVKYIDGCRQYPLTRPQYDASIKDTYRRYTTRDMVRLSFARCVFQK